MASAIAFFRNKRSVKPVPAPAPTALHVTEANFPSFGGVRAPNSSPVFSFAPVAVVPDENTPPPNTTQLRQERVIQDALRALGPFIRAPPTAPPFVYINNDDRYQAYLDEQDYLDAVQYDAENPLPEPVVQEWTQEIRVAPKIRPVDEEELVEDEWTEEEARSRIEFLRKRLRRNGILREDREAYETEIRDLQTMLYDSD